MKKPLIGITLDHELGGKAYSKFPWYALRENYASSIVQSGGIPIPLSHDLELIDTYLELLNGIVITGGAFDVDPSLYGVDDTHNTVKTKGRRTEFEWSICEKFLEKNKPILGICGGQQLLNVVLGGTLIQHIPDEIQTTIPHEQPNPRDEVGHTVEIKTNTQLAQIVGTNELSVNSAHHQAVKELGNNCILNAVAPDGVVEGFEVSTQHFCIGLQWHPEFFISEGDKKIFSAFVEACCG